MVVGRPLSYWEGNFSVAMLNFWGVLVHVFVQHIQDTLRVFVHGSFTSMLLAWPSTFVIESPSWIWWLIPFCRGQNKKQAVTALQYTSCNSHRIHSTACQWPSQRRHWLGLYYKRPRQTGSWSPPPPKICSNRSFLQQKHENKYNIWHLISILSWVYHLSQLAYPSSDTPGAGKSEAARKMPLLVPPWEGDSSTSEPHWRHLDLVLKFQKSQPNCQKPIFVGSNGANGQQLKGIHQKFLDHDQDIRRVRVAVVTMPLRPLMMVVWIARCMAAKWKNAADKVENVKLTFQKQQRCWDGRVYVFSHAHAGVTPLFKKRQALFRWKVPSSAEGAFWSALRLLKSIENTFNSPLGLTKWPFRLHRKDWSSECSLLGCFWIWCLCLLSSLGQEAMPTTMSSLSQRFIEIYWIYCP